MSSLGTCATGRGTGLCAAGDATGKGTGLCATGDVTGKGTGLCTTGDAAGGSVILGGSTTGGATLGDVLGGNSGGLCPSISHIGLCATGGATGGGVNGLAPWNNFSIPRGGVAGGVGATAGLGANSATNLLALSTPSWTFLAAWSCAFLIVSSCVALGGVTGGGATLGGTTGGRVTLGGDIAGLSPNILRNVGLLIAILLF